jgi:hypothetical protein
LIVGNDGARRIEADIAMPEPDQSKQHR